MPGKKNSFLLRLMAAISTGVLLSTGLAFGQNSISVGSAQGEPGSEVTVAVKVTSNEDVAGISFALSFDPSRLQIKGTANGFDAAAMTPVGVDAAAANSNGTLKVSLVDFSFANPVAAGENREIYVVTFTIAAGAAEGEIPLELSGTSVSNPAGSDIPVTVNNGAVTVSSAEPEPQPTGNAIWVGCASGSPGGDVTVKIALTSQVGIAGAQFELNFDRTRLQIKETANGTDASPMTQEGIDVAAADLNGSLEVSLVDFTFVNPVAAGEDREIYVVTFTIAAGVSGEISAATMVFRDQQFAQLQDLIYNLGNLPEQPSIFGPTVCVLGLAYKEGVDITEESPGQELYDWLVFHSKDYYAYNVVAYDPAVREHKHDLTEVVENSDVLVVMTRWPEFRELEDMDLEGKIVIDMWGYLDNSKLNCTYVRFGRGS